MNQPNSQLQVKADDKTILGVYSNSAQVQFQKEEFVLDFMLHNVPPVAMLTSRVILSPGHAKRLANVLAEVVKRYEAQHGVIAAAEAPAEIGFATK